MQPPKDLTEAGCTVQQLKIYSYSATKKLFGPRRSEYILYWAFNVDGYDWIVRYYPYHSDLSKDWLAFRLLPRKKFENEVKVTLQCQLVDENGVLPPFGNQRVTCRFKNTVDPGPPLLLLTHEELLKLDYLKNDSFVVECTISVLRSPEKVATHAPSMPSTSLHQQLGELLHSQKGTDIIFNVSGESFMAHKAILAARSPIFMAEFFGPMKESSSDVVEIKGVQPAAFKAMLHFIYTDICPDFAQQHSSDMVREEVTALAQHLLAAADRYGLERLKLICEDKLYSCIDVGTVAMTLALADQLNCSRLKKRCIEFIVASLENLDAVMVTEGYKHLMASCPLVVNDLLRAAMCNRALGESNS